MKRLITKGLTITSLFFLIACSYSEKQTPTEIIIKESDIVKKSIGVNGMTCVGCEVTLEESISKIIGVVDVKASATKDEAVIRYDSTKTDLRTITTVIKESGYNPVKILDKD